MTLIAQVTDCHLFGDTEKCGYNAINPYLSLSLVLSKVAEKNPDVLLVTGDISGDDSQQSYHHFLALIAENGFTAKLKVIAGNHDNSANFEACLGQYDLASSGPLSLGNWMLHGVDTRYEGTLGKLEPHQLKALNRTLWNKANHYHVVACHHHPLNIGGWMDKHTFVNKGEFVEMISAHKNVKALLYGHVHSEKQDRSNDLVFSACPSSCWQFSQADDFGITDQVPGFNLIQLAKDGGLDISTIRINQEHNHNL